MDTAPSPVRLAPVVTPYPVARFTAEQYLAMIRAEILTKDDKVELIDGVITPMSPSGEEHYWCVLRLTSLLVPANPTHWLSVQGTIRIGERSVFDPDFALVRRGGSQTQLPSAKVVDLVIEVAKTSLKKDRTTKGAAYAAAGIPEYWVVDVEGERVWVHRDPAGEAYQSVAESGLDATLTPLALPSVEVRVREVFGK